MGLTGLHDLAVRATCTFAVLFSVSRPFLLAPQGNAACLGAFGKKYLELNADSSPARLFRRSSPLTESLEQDTATQACKTRSVTFNLIDNCQLTY